MKYLGLGLIRIYQHTLSVIMPSSCRFEPSCSRYAYTAIDRYGLLRGEIDAEIIILTVVSVFVLFGVAAWFFKW